MLSCVCLHACTAKLTAEKIDTGVSIDKPVIGTQPSTDVKGGDVNEESALV